MHEVLKIHFFIKELVARFEVDFTRLEVYISIVFAITATKAFPEVKLAKPFPDSILFWVKTRPPLDNVLYNKIDYFVPIITRIKRHNKYRS